MFDPARVVLHEIRSRDGLSLQAQSYGDGEEFLLLSNGLGGNFGTWRHLIGEFSERFKVIAWDFRGLHGSERPEDDHALGLDAHVDDLFCLLEHFGVERAVFAGWSMGVQVNFEAFRRNPQMVRGLLILNGTAGNVFDMFVPLSDAATREVQKAVDAISNFPQVLNPIARGITQWKHLIPTLKTLGVVGHEMDEELVGDLVHEFGNLDFGTYFKIAASYADHQAWDLLPEIEVPTTIVAGSKDILTPLRFAHRMAKGIENSELIVLEGATHYAPAEVPHKVCEALSSLIQRIDAHEAQSKKGAQT